MPDKPNTVLAIDIGSSRIHAGLVDTAALRCLRREDFLRGELHARLHSILDEWLGPALQPMPAVIAGGRDGTAAAVEAILSKRKIPSRSLTWSHDLPIRFRYEKPEQLGADRIAHALYAGAAYPDRNVVIIGAGTAITVDAVTAGREFTGGVILPGTQLQLQSLHASTVLPEVDAAGPLPFPGTSTETCMRTGVLLGAAGAISCLVNRHRTLLDGPCTVLATGGGWPQLSGLVDFEAIYLQDLTLLGIGLWECRAEGCSDR